MMIVDEDHTPTAGHFGMFESGSIVVTAGAATSIGLARVNNEDSYAVSAPVYVVADGMGGLARGDEASAFAVRDLVARWSSSGDPTDAAIEVNSALVDYVGGPAIVGTTLVACRIESTLASFISVGDSRAYLLRGPQMRQLTRDDNVREALARLDRSDAGMAESLLEALTSYVGIGQSEFAAHVFSLDLSFGDRVLLCTDGLHRQVAEDMIARLLCLGSAQDAAEALVAAADQAGGIDNSTAIVLEVGVTGVI